MTREEFITERTRIISEMLDNPNECGIYPTTKCFEQLDALFDEISAPSPSSATAEEILTRHLGSLMPLKYGVKYNKTIDAMHEFATLHAQKIADKMASERLRGKFLLAYDELRDLCCRFFRHWWNSPGANTEEGFDTWAEMNNLKSRDSHDSKS